MEIQDLINMYRLIEQEKGKLRKTALKEDIAKIIELVLLQILQ